MMAPNDNQQMLLLEGGRNGLNAGGFSLSMASQAFVVMNSLINCFKKTLIYQELCMDIKWVLLSGWNLAGDEFTCSRLLISLFINDKWLVCEWVHDHHDVYSGSKLPFLPINYQKVQTSQKLLSPPRETVGGLDSKQLLKKTSAVSKKRRIVYDYERATKVRDTYF